MPLGVMIVTMRMENGRKSKDKGKAAHVPAVVTEREIHLINR